MAVTITTADVRAEYPSESTGVSDTMLEGYIAQVDTADDCLDAYSVPDAVQTSLKMLGVGHLLHQSSGAASVASERDANGAAVSYRDGSMSSAYNALVSMDTYGCVVGVVSTKQAALFQVVAGRVDD